MFLPGGRRQRIEAAVGGGLWAVGCGAKDHRWGRNKRGEWPSPRILPQCWNPVTVCSFFLFLFLFPFPFSFSFPPVLYSIAGECLLHRLARCQGRTSSL